MTLKIGISPCPNDTYIFEGLAQKVIDTSGLKFEFEYHDIDELNHKAAENELDIVKISYAHYFNIADQYILLRSGGAMGYGVGPLLLSKTELQRPKPQHTVAIPGVSTTANFLLQYAYPELTQKTTLPFHQIEDALLSQTVDLGLIIHENRFTYQNKGLHCIQDLGALWEEKEQLPIPLGGIAIRKSIGENVACHVQALIQRSLQWQQEKRFLSTYIQQHAQSMQPDIMQQHIDLYVNAFSFDVGEDGIRSISFMKSLLRPEFNKPIFVSC